MAKKMTIVLFSGELDRALAAFNVATTAASMGMEVTIFFTFWGLNAIRKQTSGRKASGWMRKMFNWMNRGGTRNLPLSKFDMVGVGRSMMKKVMKDSNLPSLEEMMSLAKELGVRFIACTTTIGMMGLGPEDFVSYVDEYAGAATYLGQAQQGVVNLFI